MRVDAINQSNKPMVTVRLQKYRHIRQVRKKRSDFSFENEIYKMKKKDEKEQEVPKKVR